MKISPAVKEFPEGATTNFFEPDNPEILAKTVVTPLKSRDIIVVVLLEVVRNSRPRL
jgi:hypothetical protein